RRAYRRGVGRREGTDMGTVTTGTGPRRPLGGRAASFAAAALAMSVLTACWPWSAPVGEPATPEPVSTSPAPVDPDLLAVTAQRCGTTEPAAVGALRGLPGRPHPEHDPAARRHDDGARDHGERRGRPR